MDTNAFFSGGNGMFLQYHDIVKPTYLYAIAKMIIENNAFGLPIQIIRNFSVKSLLEWYTTRRYVNPLSQLDYKHSIPSDQLDQLMRQYLLSDQSIYKMAPQLSTMQMFTVYRTQHFQFPVFIYSKEYDECIEKDVDVIMNGINHHYVYGNLSDALKKTDNNFTYIFSDIELAKQACEILIGTCSNILIPRDYRYNYNDNYATYKYDLMELAHSHPFIRLETIVAMDFRLMNGAFNNLIQGGG